MALKTPSPIIGLDISTDAVRLVCLTVKRGKVYLENMDVEPLPSGAVNDNEITDSQAVSSCIRTMLHRSRVKTKNVAVALPATAAIVKMITLPDTMDEMAIEEHIQYNGGQYIPYSMDAVNFDFKVVGASTDQVGSTRVLLVASKKESVDDMVATLEETGLKPKVVDVKTFSLLLLHGYLDKLNKAVKAADNGHVTILVDIGYAMTTVYAFKDGYPIYFREHAFGSGRLIDAIQNRYNVKVEDAQRMERFGGLPPDYATDVLQPFSRNTAQELFRAIDFFQASNPDIPVSRVSLFGSGAKSQIVDYVHQMVSFPVDIPDPFHGMQVSPQINSSFLDANRSSMSVACGLALRGVTK